jgi:peptidoglycan/xylan/chitin deacetylase (PgdA/CDA1 family)
MANSQVNSLGTKSAFSSFVARARGKYQRATARYLSKQPFTVLPSSPIISFTFDDFPRSALLKGGQILQSFGVGGTFYTSLGLIGKHSDTGEMLVTDDLGTLVEQGHELGCHTFGHCHAWNTSPAKFEAAIRENGQALQKLIPGASFHSHSYPIGVPRANTKRVASKYFSCCRGGGQTLNRGTVDLNYLSAYFLEQSRDDPGAIKRIIDENSRRSGWLIFATHDVCDDPTHWGCTPSLFEDIVRYAVHSGARILPVFEALILIRFESKNSSTAGRFVLKTPSRL